jgi:5'-nucleotidase
LITNDDGIHSPGLHAAAAAVIDVADLLLVAPSRQQSGMARSWPITPHSGVITETPLIIKDQQVMGYSVTGSPAQAVSHAVWELADRQPNLCISGINYGENVGSALNISGTVGAAFEAASYGIPALAMSLMAEVTLYHTEYYAVMDWVAAEYFTALFAGFLLDNGLPEEASVLNVNIPHGATVLTPIRQTRQSKQEYFVLRQPGERDFAKPFQFGLGIEIDEATVEPDSDIRAVAIDEVISATPLTWSMTANCELKLPDVD